MALRIIEYRCSSTTHPTSLGSAIARGFIRDAAQRIDVSTVGAKATSIAVKALAHARGFIQEKHMDLVFTLCFGKFTAEGEEMTKVIFQIYKAEDGVHLKLLAENA